jgi:hypothetical protein
MLERPPPARLSMPTLRKRKARRATVQLATRKWADRGEGAVLRCTGDLPKINGSHPLPRRGSGEPALKKRINVLQNGGT